MIGAKNTEVFFVRVLEYNVFSSFKTSEARTSFKNICLLRLEFCVIFLEKLKVSSSSIIFHHKAELILLVYVDLCDFSFCHHSFMKNRVERGIFFQTRVTERFHVQFKPRIENFLIAFFSLSNEKKIREKIKFSLLRHSCVLFNV